MTLDTTDKLIREVAKRLRSAKRVLFITGAGISAESGLPTYRGISGLYENATTEEGYSIEEALSGLALAFQPEITWKYLAQIELACRGARPNTAHFAIARLENEIISELLILTQNVDGLHHQAGSRNVIEIHGNLRNLVCTACDYTETVNDWSEKTLPPQCPKCAGLLRPDIVLFGEMLHSHSTERLHSFLSGGVDLVFSIGTSSLFPYISGPVEWAIERHIPTVEINPNKTRVSDKVDYYLPLGAADAMVKITKEMRDAY